MSWDCTGATVQSNTTMRVGVQSCSCCCFIERRSEKRLGCSSVIMLVLRDRSEYTHTLMWQLRHSLFFFHSTLPPNSVTRGSRSLLSTWHDCVGGLGLLCLCTTFLSHMFFNLWSREFIDRKLSAVIFKWNAFISFEGLKEKVDSFTLRSEHLVAKTGPELLKLLGALVCVKDESYGVRQQSASERATNVCLHSQNLIGETSYNYWGGSRAEDSCLARWSKKCVYEGASRAA